MKVPDSVARLRRAPPYAARRKDLSFDLSNCLRSQSYRSTIVICNCTIRADTVAPRRNKANPFRRSSILFRPRCPPNEGILVESPGTAPGSDPLITSAFMSIVPEGT